MSAFTSCLAWASGDVRFGSPSVEKTEAPVTSRLTWVVADAKIRTTYGFSPRFVGPNGPIQPTMALLETVWPLAWLRVVPDGFSSPVLTTSEPHLSEL